MLGKTTPPELITAQEAIALFQYATISEMYTVKELEEVYRACKGKDQDTLWGTLSILSFIYDTGRIRGIREERAKRRRK